MTAPRQTTIQKSASLSGVGLHSGADCRVVIRPAAADAGVVFRKESGAVVRAAAAAVADTRLCTRLANDTGDAVGMVEHLMAAFAITSLDNAIVEIEGPEVPILDGSAAPYVEAIEASGVVALTSARPAIRIIAPVEFRDGTRIIRAEPHDGRIIEVAIEFDDAAIGAQSLTLDLDRPEHLRRLAHARTFCRLADVEVMRRAGLSLGGSLDNAIVVDGGRILNPEGLRDPSEFTLHKALDLVGDLRLAGWPIIGKISARRPGHDLNARFLRHVLASSSAWMWRSPAPQSAHAGAAL
jgi:UDP-3-O-[3-hydroxymyristoyl] N-acetylglucosamine deacetylase